MDLPLVCRMSTTLLPVPRYNSKTNTFKCKASVLISKEKEPNLYKVLSLDSEKVGADAVKRAYRSMALRYHPDVCPPSKREESMRMFIELQRAYETLSDPVMREMYDYKLGLVGLGDGEEFKGMRRRQERTRFSKEVWINQLNELTVRSTKRMARKQQGCL